MLNKLYQRLAKHYKEYVTELNQDGLLIIVNNNFHVTVQLQSGKNIWRSVVSTSNTAHFNKCMESREKHYENIRKNYDYN